MAFHDEKKKFANEYLDLMTVCFTKVSEFPSETKPSFLNLSTMTMVCDLTHTIDILSFSDNFSSPLEQECTIKRPKHSTEFDVTKRGKKKKTFFNQASIHYKTHTTKCIKVFSNGRLHITGVTSMIEASEVCEFTCRLLNNTRGAVRESGKVEALDLKICMINTNFALNHGINILKLKTMLSVDENIMCSYTPDTYPGLKIKYTHADKNKSSVFIFSSGQIVITGVKQLPDIIEVFSSIMDIICFNFKAIYNPNIQLKKPKKKSTECKFGYEISLIKPCLPVC